MRGDAPQPGDEKRYIKFAWSNLDYLPDIGKTDYEPKGGAFRMFEEGVFYSEHLHPFPIIKNKYKLNSFNRCVYCGKIEDENGIPLPLTSEHIIPEFLGSGLELPSASCEICQKNTSDFEATIAQELFDPVRKSFNLQGKSGAIGKLNFPLDIGRETSDHFFIPLLHHPTILVLPALYPASSYSRRPVNSDDIFNLRLYNINADKKILKKYDLEGFSSQALDLVRFSQMIAKIAHVYAMHYFGFDAFEPTVSDFIRTNFPPRTYATGHLQYVGGLWQRQDKPSQNLHEIEAGKITWNGQVQFAARVRLFACCGMPSYYVTVGKPKQM